MTMYIICIASCKIFVFWKIAKDEVNKHLIHLAIKVGKKLQIKKTCFSHTVK